MPLDEFVHDFTLSQSEYKDVLYDYIANGYAPPLDSKNLGAWLAAQEKNKIKEKVLIRRFSEEKFQSPSKVNYEFEIGWVLEKGSAKVFLGKVLFPLGVKMYLGHCSYFSGRSWIRGRGTLRIGNFSCIANSCVIDTSPREHSTDYAAHINWGKNRRVRHIGLAVNTAPESKPEIVYIGNDVWFGEEVRLGAGVAIGDGSAVGRASLVLKDIPEYEIWGGLPAKKIRDRFSLMTKNKIRSTKWWYFTDHEIRSNKLFFEMPFQSA